MRFERALPLRRTSLIALKGRGSKAQGETLGPGVTRCISPVRAAQSASSTRCGSAVTFCAALSGLSAANEAPQGSAALHLGLYCRALSGLQSVASLWGLLDTTRSAGGVFIRIAQEPIYFLPDTPRHKQRLTYRPDLSNL